VRRQLQNRLAAPGGLDVCDPDNSARFEKRTLDLKADARGAAALARCATTGLLSRLDAAQVNAAFERDRPFQELVKFYLSSELVFIVSFVNPSIKPLNPLPFGAENSLQLTLQGWLVLH
jgi:hypothetical protein